MNYLIFKNPPKSLKSLLMFLILTSAAVVGNYFNIMLMPGVYFVFGSIGVLMAVWFYGTAWGFAAALISTIINYFFNHLPIVFVLLLPLEALFVGSILKHRKTGIILVDGFFWLTCGVPLTFLMYKFLFGLDMHLISLIVLKVFINGVFSSLVVSLIITYLPFYKIFNKPDTQKAVPYNTALFNVFIGLALIPSFLLLIIKSDYNLNDMKKNLEFQAKHQASEIAGQLSFWQQEHLNPLLEMAVIASTSEMKPTKELQNYLVRLKRTAPEFVGMAVCNKDGISIAIDPETTPDGKPAVGLDFSSRDYYKMVSASWEPFVTPVFKGRTAVVKPVVAISVPVITDESFNGIVTGALELDYIQDLLRLNTVEEEFNATVVDSNGMVISSTRKDTKPLTNFYHNRKGHLKKLSTGISQWFPSEYEGKHESIRWINSFYVTEKKVENMPWTLITEIPVALHQKHLSNVYIKDLALLFCIIIIIVWFSGLFSRRMTMPLSELANFAGYLPRTLNSNKNLDWSHQSNILEIDSLKNSFRSMTDILRQNFEELKEQYHFSSALNKIAAVIASEKDNRAILEQVNKITGQTLDTDVSVVYNVNFDKGKIEVVCQWFNDRNPGLPRKLEGLNLQQFAKCNEYIMKNPTWIESHQSRVACCLAEDIRDPHTELGITSLICYPFSFHEGGYHILFFGQLNEERSWQAEELQFVSAVTKQIEIALQKIDFINNIWEEKEKAQVTLDSIGDAVITTDSEARLVYLNPVAEQLTGWKNHEAKGMPLMKVFEIVSEETGQPLENPVYKCLSRGSMVELANHTVLISRSGQRFAIENSAAPIKGKDGTITGVILVFHDVSEKRQMVTQLRQLAYYDPLTQLPNRILFNDRLTVALAKAQRDREMLAIMLLDLDRFKLVNDMMGHVTGDILLKEVAVRLSKCLRKTDTMCRLGGDEFTFILPAIISAEDAAKVARKILGAIQMPFTVNCHEFHISASIGIAVFPHDGDDAETMMKHADLAMYQAKEQNLNSYRFFTAELNTRITERMIIEQSLRKSVETMDFILYYQPQLNISTGRIESVEALIRWNHPEKGAISPEEFIPLAEDSGLILPIGKWVLQTACTQAKAWQIAGYPGLTVSVNISAYQFRGGDLTGLVAQVLRQTGLEPQFLEIEITESITMNDVENTVQILTELKRMGVKIAIDDFGTGYSSLNYLKCFPINTLKIDRSFITDVISNPGDAAIVTSIIDIAKNLSLSVIAEGIETVEQLQFLMNKGCERIQGYYFSKPVPVHEIERLFLKDWSAMCWPCRH